MQPYIKKFVKLVSDTLPTPEPIYEFGALQVPGQEGYADLRPFFPGKKYIGCDMQAGPGVDSILNLHNIELANDSAGTVLILETLEHVEFPGRAMEEIHRILSKDGMVVISSVMNFPIHDYPHDYWRFTPQGLESLLREFKVYSIHCLGNESFPNSLVGVGSKSASVDLTRFNSECEKLKKQYSEFPVTAKMKTVIRLMTPPWMIYVCRKLRLI